MSISLESSIRTCKVDTGYSTKVQSDRFLNPNNMVCPVWNGMDSAGRRVCPDSFWTKNAGCNSAEDRVVVENNQRPQYMEYINLSANGIDGSIYGDVTNYVDQGMATQDLRNSNNITGNFGLQWKSDIAPPCGYNRYEQGMSLEEQQMRKQQALQMGYQANAYKKLSGFSY
jgi:hypothetical protein